MEIILLERIEKLGAIGDVVTARAATFFPAIDEFYGGDRPWRLDQAAAELVTLGAGPVVVDDVVQPVGRQRRPAQQPQQASGSQWPHGRDAARLSSSSAKLCSR